MYVAVQCQKSYNQFVGGFIIRVYFTFNPFKSFYDENQEIYYLFPLFCRAVQHSFFLHI